MDDPKRPAPGWGSRIAEARVVMRGKRGRPMTQNELGKAVGVSGSMVGFYESETYIPSGETWERMAEAMDVRDRWLVFNEQPRDVARDRKVGPTKGQRAG